MSDIADFLAARIHEDEMDIADSGREDPGIVRAAAEVRAKRGILLDYMTRLTKYNIVTKNGLYYNHERPDDLPLRYLALPYAWHPDYREWWSAPEPGSIAVHR